MADGRNDIANARSEDETPRMRRPEEDAKRDSDRCHDEDEQQNPIHHYGHKLPLVPDHFPSVLRSQASLVSLNRSTDRQKRPLELSLDRLLQL